MPTSIDDLYEGYEGDDSHQDDDVDLSGMLPGGLQPDDTDPELDFEIANNNGNDMSGIMDFNMDDDDDDDNQDNDGTPKVPQELQLIQSLLKAKGINDLSAIKYENEDGEIEDVDFTTLPIEEQLAILNSTDADINFGLSDSETDAVNFLRENKVDLKSAIDYYQKKAVEDYINSQNISGLEVNQYTDEELFALDLKTRYEDFTEEEIELELAKQLEHPELFKKKVDKLRSEYKEIETSQLEQSRLEAEGEETAKIEELTTSLVGVAQSIEDIGGLDIDVDDKNEILTYILDKDLNGNSSFIKDLDDPKKLFELAWYSVKGKEAFNIIHDYYKKEIENVRKASYKKGIDEAKTSTRSVNTQVTPKGRAVFKPAGNGNQGKVLSMNDLKID